MLKGCTKTAFDPLRAASHQAAKASGARESLPQPIFVALHATNLGQLLENLPFFFVRKTLLECSLLVTDALAPRRDARWRHVKQDISTIHPGHATSRRQSPASPRPQNQDVT
jgi:hypothetical protein